MKGEEAHESAREVIFDAETAVDVEAARTLVVEP